MAILDEIDSGLDIDALRDVSAAVNGLRKPDRAVLMITHYQARVLQARIWSRKGRECERKADAANARAAQRLLDYIEPDFVHVMIEGKIVQTGGKARNASLVLLLSLVFQLTSRLRVAGARVAAGAQRLRGDGALGPQTRSCAALCAEMQNSSRKQQTPSCVSRAERLVFWAKRTCALQAHPSRAARMMPPLPSLAAITASSVHVFRAPPTLLCPHPSSSRAMAPPARCRRAAAGEARQRGAAEEASLEALSAAAAAAAPAAPDATVHLVVAAPRRPRNPENPRKSQTPSRRCASKSRPKGHNRVRP